jgi:hypothetical protein
MAAYAIAVLARVGVKALRRLRGVAALALLVVKGGIVTPRILVCDMAGCAFELAGCKTPTLA